MRTKMNVIYRPDKKFHTRLLKCWQFFLFSIFLMSCNQKDKSHDDRISTRERHLKYATHLDIVSEEKYTRLTIVDPWQKSSGLKLEYYLVKDERDSPAGVDNKNIIKVPVRRVVLMSTTYIPMITALGQGNSVVALSGTSFVCDPWIRERIKSGQVHEAGYEEYLNRELILRLSPDLIIAYGIGSATAGSMRILQETGIKVLFNAEYLEEDPLGRAEWIKVFGALFCCEPAADSIFSLVENRYTELKSWLQGNITTRPKVLLGLPWKDAWYISPGNSYISKLIEDAGGEYVWKDLKADHAVPFSVENVLVNAADASYWLNTGNASDLKSILAVDPRTGYIRAFKERNIFNNNKRVSEGGGNDYWESGVLNPEVILKDIASVLHPELFPDYVPYYYRKIE